MSFFGFDPSQAPHERGHNTAAPGFGQHADPFASLSGTGNDNEAFDFEDTYDGLGDQLQETGDDFNDDTFGGGAGDSIASKPVGNNFDFFGQTAKVSDAINEEQMRYTRQQPVVSRTTPAASSYSQQHTSRPARTGYERYQESEYVPDMQVDANLWGVAPKQAPKAATPPAAGTSAPSRKMMSLEEVEAAMRAQAKKPSQSQLPVQQQPMPPSQPQYQQLPPQQYQNFHQQAPLQAPQQQQQQFPIQASAPPQSEQRQLPVEQQIHILQRPQVPTSQANVPSIPIQPAHMPNMNRFPNQPHGGQRGHHHPHASGNRHVITHPQQLVNLSEEERAAFLLEDAKRAKRNHKIFLLSKDNGLMTPQDKNFITRIQLQQLVTATGNPNEHGIDSSLSEDFYYQVHSQIRGGPRQNPHQPLSNFAQTYLFQTGNRHNNMRRQARGGDNHVQRMEQQVQRAVEAAKNKPKNKQLVIEGSLGKISFSNAKTPKPLLNIKRTDSNEPRPGNSPNPRKANLVSGSNRKSILTDIENVYNTLMELEDHERSKPRPLGHDEINPQIAGLNQDWNERQEFLNRQLWRNLRIHEPIGATTVHPFIAFLSFNKGKKAIPRVFRHISDEQRATILTMIILHLDKLDVVRLAVPSPDGIQLSAETRENIDLFQVTVMSSLFGFLHDADFQITTGVLGLILNLNIDLIARTRIGLSLLTMILSRAEITKQAGDVDERGWNDWLSTHNAFFDALEPTLPEIFPGTVNTGEDVYVWQFLAAIGIGANPEQQQRLVMAVKDRVMETVGLAKTLPPAMSIQRLANVNLFMRSIGLDVELLA